MNYFDKLYKKVKESDVAYEHYSLTLESEHRQLRVLATLFPNVNLECKRIYLIVKHLHILSLEVIQEIDKYMEDILISYKSPELWRNVSLRPWKAIEFTMTNLKKFPNPTYYYLINDDERSLIVFLSLILTIIIFAIGIVHKNLYLTIGAFPAFIATGAFVFSGVLDVIVSAFAYIRAIAKIPFNVIAHGYYNLGPVVHMQSEKRFSADDTDWDPTPRFALEFLKLLSKMNFKEFELFASSSRENKLDHEESIGLLKNFLKRNEIKKIEQLNSVTLDLLRKEIT
jgi:hypothetical protein